MMRFKGITSILTRSGVSEDYLNKELLHPFYSRSKESHMNKENYVDHCIKTCRKTIQVEELKVSKDKPKCFIYLSFSGSGQSSLIKKIASRQGDGEIYNYVKGEVPSKASQILGINQYNFSDHAKLFSAVRKSMSQGRNTHIDLRVSDQNTNELIQLLNLLKSSIQSCVTCLTASGRFSFKYNSKLFTRFGEYADYFNLTFWDECYEIGSVFNLFYQNPDLKISYISNGEVIPEDIEVASSDFIVEKLFNI